LHAAADGTEVVIVRAPSEDLDLRCGGLPMLPIGKESGGSNGQSSSLDPDFSSGTALGKRYVDESDGLEVLCTKAGNGSLSIGSDLLVLKAAKALPASD
jgi:hypothetical protein